MGEEEIAAALAFFKGLADESRLRILGLLAGKPRSVEELAAALELRTPTVSHHLQTLRRLGIVEMRPEGPTPRYRLDLRRLQYGFTWVLLVFFAIWATDTGAFFVGRAFGGR